jgi:putative peptide zinc metalloprotease protein
MSPPATLAADTAAIAVTSATRVTLHPLRMRASGETWVIGRMDTGEFATMPPVARRVIALLGDGQSVGQTVGTLYRETGRQLAVGEFVAALDQMGFLAAVDGQPRHGPVPIQASLPWLRPRHVCWLLHPVVPWLVLGIVTAAAVVAAAAPALIPRYHALIWSQRPGLVLAGNAALGWALIWLHEGGHLATARAAGVPARLQLRTRLQFLTAQTDVSGIWAAPRRVRLTVYLAGMAVDLLLAATCLLAGGLAVRTGLAHRLLAAAALESVLFLPLEFLIFMRTDIYFVLQDLAGCANLYADGAARVRYLARRAWRASRHDGGRPADPARALAPGERWAVHAYAWILLGGTTLCLAAAVLVTAPATITLVARAIGELAGAAPGGQADGAAAIAVICGLQLLWLRAWWRQHGDQVRACLRRRHQQPACLERRPQQPAEGR